MSISGSLLGLGMVGLAIWIFDRTLSHYEIAEVVRRFGDIPAWRIALAGAMVAASYFVQSLYDYLSAAAVGKPTALRRTTLAGCVSNAMVNSMGFSWLTAASLRYRFYSGWGLGTLEIAQVVALTKLSFFAGLLFLGGVTQLIAPVEPPGRLGEILSPRLLGAVLLAGPILLLIGNGFARGAYFHMGKLRLSRPSQRIVLLQILASAGHLVFSGFALYFLLPSEALAAAGLSGGVAFLSVFMVLKVVILFFPIPGGLGVLEGTAMALLTPAIPDYPLLGALLAYRICYFLAPFALALAALAIYELGVRSGLASGIRTRIRRPGPLHLLPSRAGKV